MASNLYTAEALLASIRRRAFIPTDTQSWPDADVLALLNEELTDWLVPFVLEAREDHFQVSVDQALTAGLATYTIPSDAAGDTVFSLHLVDASGNPLCGLAKTDLENLTQLQTSTGQPCRYGFRGNSIVLWPTPTDATQKLRIVYPRRPSQVVASSECAAITVAVDNGNGTFTVTFASKPAGFSSSATFDVVSSVPGFEALGPFTQTGTTTTTLTLSGSLPATAVVGAYVCISDQAPVLTYVPAELWSFLAQRLVVKLVEAKGDDSGLNRALKGLKDAEDRARKFLGKRAAAAHLKIPGGFRASNRLGPSWARRG